jgi:predicted nucleic acid-binding protein
VTAFLADTTAWSRSASPSVYERWSELLSAGRLALCSPVRLELLYSARDPADYERLAYDLDQLPRLAFDRRAAVRAEGVQALLASHSQHRGPAPVDLLIAAIAETNEATLLHYDRHFDAIARVTGQSAEWVAPRGTLD